MRFLIPLLLLLTALPAWTQVYRCGNNYQATPCTGGREVDVRIPVSAGSPTENLVFLCKRYDGQSFWAAMPCHQYQKAMLEREVRVPADLSWKEQVAYARKVRNEAEALQVPPRVRVTSAPKAVPNCERFQQALERNASAARAGGSARYMDRLNDERRKLFAEKWRAGC